MLELTKEQMEAIQKAISKKAEESVQEFDKELDVVGLSTLFQTNFFRLFFRYCTGV